MAKTYETGRKQRMAKQLEHLYSQNKLAEILGISKGTLSKWLRDNSVSPKQQKGQRKLYDKTVIEQYKKIKKSHNNSTSKDSMHLTTVQLLQDSLNDKQKEIDYLREQLKAKDQILADKDKTIADFGQKFAKLADQAQQLNLVDKTPQKLTMSTSDEKNGENKKAVSVSEEKTDTAKKKHWWQWNTYKS